MSKKNYVQIGAGAGDLDPRGLYRDGFTELVKRLDRSTIGKIILVEPNPHNIPKLQLCWKDYPQARIINKGICVNSDSQRKITFYYIDDDAPHYQVFSMIPEHVRKHYPGSSSELKTVDVECVTLQELIECELGSNADIELLGLDIEGIDGEVMLDTDWTRFTCNTLSYEHLHISPDILKRIEIVLNSVGMYDVGNGIDVNGYDTMFRRKV